VLNFEFGRIINQDHKENPQIIKRYLHKEKYVAYSFTPNKKFKKFKVGYTVQIEFTSIK